MKRLHFNRITRFLRISALCSFGMFPIAAAISACVQVADLADAVPRSDWERCIPITVETSRIREPGKYCLKESLISRMNLPDRRSETMLMLIESSDVEIDLMGHTIGRRTGLFGNAGGGIVIGEKVSNLTVRNGSIKNVYTCVARFAPSAGGAVEYVQPVVKGSRDFDFPELQIRFRNVSITDCQELFSVQVPRKR